MYYLKKLSGITGNDGFVMNPIFEQLFFIMGIWPVRPPPKSPASACSEQGLTIRPVQAIYAALLIPGGRSGNKVRV